MTGLTALNPLFLSLLPLAALPVLFHLFFRLKKQPRPFSTLMFFHRIDSRLNARRRLREWLILLLRTLLIAVLMLCLAHPVWRGVGKEGSVAMVLLLDNSGAMSGAGANAQPKLREAVTAARTLIAQLRPGDSAGIVLLVPDIAVALPTGLTTDKSALLEALEHIGGTEASGSVAAAVERAVAMLENAAGAHGEIHLFSDLQQEKWSQAPLNLRAPPRGTSIVVHRLASGVVRANVTLAGSQILAHSILPGRRLPLEVRLVNSSALEAPIRVNWLDDAGHRGSEEMSLPPQAEKTASLMLDPQEPGLRWVNVWAEGDDFTADNHAPLGFTCSEKQAVLLIGGTSDYGQLPLAMAPANRANLSGLTPLFAESTDLIAQLGRQPAGLVVATWESFGGQDSAQRWIALRTFLISGGNALLVPAVHPGNIGNLPEWLSITPGPLQQAASGMNFAAVAKMHPLFNDLRDVKGEVALHNLRAIRFCPLQTAATNTPLFGLEDGRVIMAEQNINKGKLLASGLAFDSGWSNLPLKPGFVALAQNLALTQTAAATNILSLVAGEPLRCAFPPKSVIQVQSLAGSPLDWKGPAARLETLPRSGIYSIRSGAETVCCAVRSSEREGRQNFLAGETLPAMGELSYSTRELAGEQGLVAEFRKLEKSLDLSWLLLLLAFTALAAEGWLANPAPLGRKNQKTLSLAKIAPEMELSK